MQHAIPAYEYNADERAERARGAGFAFLLLGLAALSLPAAALLIILL